MVHRSEKSHIATGTKAPQATKVVPQVVLPKTVNVGHQLSQRRAVAKALSRVEVIGRRFGQGKMTARVLMAGEVYDVDETRLAQLQAGSTPADLFLDPISDEG